VQDPSKAKRWARGRSRSPRSSLGRNSTRLLQLRHDAASLVSVAAQMADLPWIADERRAEVGLFMPTTPPVLFTAVTVAVSLCARRAALGHGGEAMPVADAVSSGKTMPVGIELEMPANQSSRLHQLQGVSLDRVNTRFSRVTPRRARKRWSRPVLVIMPSPLDRFAMRKWASVGRRAGW